MFAERALVARAEVTLAPAKAETYYPSGNGVSRPIHRQSRRPRASRALSRSSISHRYRPPNDVSEARSARPVDLPDRSTSDRPRSHPGNPDRARFRSFVRARVPLRKRSSATNTENKIRRVFIVSLSARTLARTPRASPARSNARARSNGCTPRDRSVALIARASSSRARRLHARATTTTTKKNTRHRARSPSLSTLVHARRRAP